MKSYDIKISGSGTLDQIKHSLLDIVRKLEFDTEETESVIEHNGEFGIEDHVLITEIK